jgi:hypothetical protein
MEIKLLRDALAYLKSFHKDVWVGIRRGQHHIYEVSILTPHGRVPFIKQHATAADIIAFANAVQRHRKYTYLLNAIYCAITECFGAHVCVRIQGLMNEK